MKNNIKIGIVDYGLGNIRSIVNALNYTSSNCSVILSNNKNELETCDGLFLPGVGAFSQAMESLRANNLIETLNKLVIDQKKPILAICLGMQLLFDFSEEGKGDEGLKWIPGRVVKFNVDKLLHVPHMGWNNIGLLRDSPLTRNLNEDKNFYFVHSFHVECPEEFSVAFSDYGKEFTVAVQRDNIFGVQFHPEKSQTNGLQLIRNYIDFVVLSKSKTFMRESGEHQLYPSLIY